MNMETPLEDTLFPGENKGMVRKNRRFILIGVGMICALVLIGIIILIVALVPHNKKASVECADLFIGGAAGGVAVAIKGQRIIETGSGASKHVCSTTRKIDAKNVCHPKTPLLLICFPHSYYDIPCDTNNQTTNRGRFFQGLRTTTFTRCLGR